MPNEEDLRRYQEQNDPQRTSETKRQMEDLFKSVKEQEKILSDIREARKNASY